MNKAYKPFAMGAAMAPMMLWMLHGQLTGSNTMSGPALVIFVGAHLLIVAILVGATFLTARLSPRLRPLLARMHRPSLQHFLRMLGGAALTAGAIHIAFHGIA